MFKMGGDFLKRLKPRARQKVMRCTRCRTLIRFPVKRNTTLRVTCPKCKTQFDISFENPFAQIFQWNRSQNMQTNFKTMFTRYRSLPGKMQRSVLIFFILVIITLIFIGLSIVTTVQDRPSPSTPRTNELSV